MAAQAHAPCRNVVEKCNVSADSSPVVTIGHSNHAPDTFAALLRQHGVNVVVDVRSAPYSRYLPHFNKEHLAESLEEAGIRYSFLGKELGGQPAERAFYDDDGRVMYDKLAATAAFKEGFEYVLDAAAVHPSTSSGRTAAERVKDEWLRMLKDERLLSRVEGRTAAECVEGQTAAPPAQRLALMCSEKEPLDCHRTLLIGQTLAKRGVAVAHIHADGSLETHEDAMNRLLDSFKLPHNGDLFRSREAVIEDAVTRQSQRVGARWREPSSL